MNPVEIEEAISHLAEQDFDSVEFPYLFLEAFGNKATTIKRLKNGTSNSSDFEGGVLQRNNIHILVCAKGEVTQTLTSLKESPSTTKAKAKFILATDGIELEAEDLASGDTIACKYTGFPDHFGFFLPLAGITYDKSIKNIDFDIKATGRLNRLYIELLKDNPAWDTAKRRHDMNHFMARLIFCFFAEDTDIFVGGDLFTATIEQMSAKNASDTHKIISELFRAMNTEISKRSSANLPRWADTLPYVNGGLFSGSTEVPKFTRIARAYLLHIGQLDWKKVNPDVFGSMIQAVADDEERGSLGMHYTSVPNILKVLNPLFLDNLRQGLKSAQDNKRKLINLSKRMANIRVFDPACGSGNFLVIAYKEMREIEAEINIRLKDSGKRTSLPLTNFRGIELRDFPAEIARLALIIAEYQCDVLYRGQREALATFLPLDSKNWITCDNALQLDWLSVCPPTGTGVKLKANDLFQSPLQQTEIDFENEGGETYICGNPPYLGSTWQSKEQKQDLKRIFEGRTTSWKSLDYVAGWFMKAADYGKQTNTVSAFVSTNSICQGQQVSILWPLIFETGHEIAFAHTSFKWANLASHNAGVTVAIIAITNNSKSIKLLFSLASNGNTIVKQVENINAYLISEKNVIIKKESSPLGEQSIMRFGNKAVDGGHLLLDLEEVDALHLTPKQKECFIRRFYGSAEFIRGVNRFVLWIEDKNFDEAKKIETIEKRINAVKIMRLASRDKSANKMANHAHQFREMYSSTLQSIIVPRVSSEAREWLPVGLLSSKCIIGDRNFALYDAPLWNMALIASRIHRVWIGTVCVRMRTDFSYSNTLGWNTFPIPKLIEKHKADLTRCAEDILLAREAHFPATIADLYKPDTMPEDLRRAHERNDETLERIYIGRKFKNDTERLEKLFSLYTKMTSPQKIPKESKILTKS